MLAYLDTNSGIAGDMTLAALVDAGADPEYLRTQIRSLGLDKVELQFTETQRHCFRALRLDVQHPPEHAHRHLSDIEQMIQASQLTAREKNIALRLFRKVGIAEAHVHGTSIEEVHFHEVGAIDSIVDIVGVAVAICNLGITRIIASPTPTGCGKINIAHGIVSVPAPATAEILKGVPIAHSNVNGELTTPTGAAILASLADGFGAVPNMQIERIGYGAGHKDFAEQANILRIIVGHSLQEQSDEVCLLETNIDDISGEQIGFAVEQLWKTGALDVYTTPISMKKNRPACLLSVICRPENRGQVEDLIFEHTSSLGIRRSTVSRRKLQREIAKVDTNWGAVRVKVSWTGFEDNQLPRYSPEYDDCKRIAAEQGVTLDSVYRTVLDAANNSLSHLEPPKNMPSGVNNELAAWNAPPPVGNSHDHSHDHDQDGHNQHDHHHH